jgi:hypothetical protein
MLLARSHSTAGLPGVAAFSNLETQNQDTAPRKPGVKSSPQSHSLHSWRLHVGKKRILCLGSLQASKPISE